MVIPWIEHGQEVGELRESCLPRIDPGGNFAGPRTMRESFDRRRAPGLARTLFLESLGREGRHVATAPKERKGGIKTTNGTRCTISSQPPLQIIDQANPTISFHKVCPAIVFAKSRTPMLDRFEDI